MFMPQPAPKPQPTTRRHKDNGPSSSENPKQTLGLSIMNGKQVPLSMRGNQMRPSNNTHELNVSMQRLSSLAKLFASYGCVKFFLNPWPNVANRASLSLTNLMRAVWGC
ncbi:hypothetical protein RRG08_046358 [Elysia crispata]|uniref:Uncharacterized protein n=1 Tax=Elysia crispata TaxID=231223 RepID=A0AAE1A4I5_9GAST|nr:hypothetical protein RRG08_046358 [Elysia crispata]